VCRAVVQNHWAYIVNAKSITHSCVPFFSLRKGDYILLYGWIDRGGIILMREGKAGCGSRAWQLARLALEDHGEGKFDNGGIFSGVPRKHI